MIVGPQCNADDIDKGVTCSNGEGFFYCRYSSWCVSDAVGHVWVWHLDRVSIPPQIADRVRKINRVRNSRTLDI